MKFIDIPFTIEPIKECRTFNIEIHIHTKENNIYYEPLALEIQSVEEKDLETIQILVSEDARRRADSESVLQNAKG